MSIEIEYKPLRMHTTLGFRSQCSLVDLVHARSVSSAQCMSLVCKCCAGVTASVLNSFVVLLDVIIPGWCHSSEKWLEKDEYRHCPNLFLKDAHSSPKSLF